MGRKSFLAPAISALSREFSGGAVPNVRQSTSQGFGITRAPQVNSVARPAIPDPVYGAQANFGRQAVVRERADPFVNPGGWTGGGGVSAAGGEWSTLDSMNSFIADAGAKTGVPPNLIKAMLAREGAFGTDKNVVNLRGEQVYAFNGIFRSTAQSYGIDFDKMTTDDAYATWAMGRVLQGIKENNPELGTWDNIAKYYFAGPNWNNPNWGDETGENTVDNYVNGPTGVITRMKYLDSLGGGGGGSWGGWGSMTPGGNVYDWGHFGVESDNNYYGYGQQYGLNGTQHTGVDIVGSWNEKYNSPISGTVTCGGTGNGAGADGGGCAAFQTMDGRGGAGRVEVLGDDGRVYIFGHSQGSFVQPGQRINVGDALGTIGWANSDHIHLEVRERDPSTPSGWRIVNPENVLANGGGNWSPGGAPPDRWGADRAGWGRWR